MQSLSSAGTLGFSCLPVSIWRLCELVLNLAILLNAFLFRFISRQGSNLQSFLKSVQVLIKLWLLCGVINFCNDAILLCGVQIDFFCQFADDVLVGQYHRSFLLLLGQDCFRVQDIIIYLSNLTYFLQVLQFYQLQHFLKLQL